MRKKKGQSMLEYVIVLTAIIAAIAWAATGIIGGKPGGTAGEKGGAVYQLLDNAANVIGSATEKLATK